MSSVCIIVVKIISIGSIEPINLEQNKYIGLRSVGGLVIQATRRTDFEDGLRPGSPGGVLSDILSLRTSSLVTPVL